MCCRRTGADHANKLVALDVPADELLNGGVARERVSPARSARDNDHVEHVLFRYGLRQLDCTRRMSPGHNTGVHQAGQMRRTCSRRTGPHCARSKYISAPILIPREHVANGGSGPVSTDAAKSCTNAETVCTPARTRISYVMVLRADEAAQSEIHRQHF